MKAADGKPDWDLFLGDYGATVDYPACSFWRELADYYPDSKVLLSVRDATSWFESVNETIMSTKVQNFIKGSPFGELNQRTIYNTLDFHMDDSDFMVSYFDRRNDEIREAIPNERLLVYQVKQGWEPLCEFLNLPVPDTPFPRVNTRDETTKILDHMIAQSGDAPDENVSREVSGDLFEDKSE